MSKVKVDQKEIDKILQQIKEDKRKEFNLEDEKFWSKKLLEFYYEV